MGPCQESFWPDWAHLGDNDSKSLRLLKQRAINHETSTEWRNDLAVSGGTMGIHDPLDHRSEMRKIRCFHVCMNRHDSVEGFLDLWFKRAGLRGIQVDMHQHLLCCAQ